MNLNILLHCLGQLVTAQIKQVNHSIDMMTALGWTGCPCATADVQALAAADKIEFRQCLLGSTCGIEGVGFKVLRVGDCKARCMWPRLSC